MTYHGCEIKSLWDGDTTSYLVYLNGEHVSSHWDLDDAKKSIDDLNSWLDQCEQESKESGI